MNRFERHPARTLLLSAVGLGCVVLAADLTAAFLWHSFGSQELRIRSPWFHHGLAPMRSAVQVWGSETIPYYTNSLGLRDAAPREVPLRSSGRRILVIGDSFTEGSGVRYEDSFVGILAAGLAPFGVEVLNAGVASYSGLCYQRKVRYLVDQAGLQVDEVVVFLDISDVYDSTTYTLDANGNVIKRRPLKRFEELIEAHTLLLGSATRMASLLYQQRAHWGLAGVAGQESGAPAPPSRGIGHHHALWTIDDTLFEQYGRRGLENETRALDGLADFARAHGLTLTIAVYPWPDQIWHRDRDSRQVRHWRDWSRARAVRFANLFPELIPDTPDFDPAAAIRTFYIEGDVHWNRAGHAQVGNGFLAWYRVQPGWLEPATSTPGR